MELEALRTIDTDWFIPLRNAFENPFPVFWPACVNFDVSEFPSVTTDCVVDFIEACACLPPAVNPLAKP